MSDKNKVTFVAMPSRLLEFAKNNPLDKNACNAAAKIFDKPPTNRKKRLLSKLLSSALALVR